MMGSKLEVSSEYGKGSRFGFVLAQGIISDETIGNINELARKAIDKNRYRKKFTAPNAKILIVDDAELNIQVVTGLLKQTGIGIDTALSGMEALDLMEKN
jgi:PleD family two-component response regulator